MSSRQYKGNIKAPDFPIGLDWLNTDTPLTMEKLLGRIVILDVWTYC